MSTHKLLFHDSFGPSKRQWPEKFVKKTTEQTQCEGCGVTHPKIEGDTNEVYHIHNILGRNVILECCGGILDEFYANHGEEFYQVFAGELSTGKNDSKNSSP